MFKKYFKMKFIITFVALSAVLFQSCSSENEDSPASKGTYKVSGGPSGGTFQYYAGALTILSKKMDFKILASASGGSIENIRLVNSGKSNFGIAYSGHVYAALYGLLRNDANKYEDLLAIAALYGAPAQLVVDAKFDNVTHPKMLAGKRVAIGNAGSGAAANAELFFTELGIFDSIDKDFLGYRAAAAALQNGQIDAFWVFTGFPSAAVLEAAVYKDVKLLSLYTVADELGMFEKYPYFSKATIPANTYKGQNKDIVTFSDMALLVAHKNIPTEVVYSLLKTVFSQEGLDYLVSVHKSANDMSLKEGLKGIVTPLHPGADKFWKEMGNL